MHLISLDMKNNELPRNVEDLERLCDKYFMDIVHGSRERFPELMVAYKTLDGRTGGAAFGQFFFFGGCTYLLRKMEEPDEDSNADVFEAMFGKYKEPKYTLAWNDCKRVEIIDILTEEEFEGLYSCSLESPEDYFLCNEKAVKDAMDCFEFDYYLTSVNKRSRKRLREAIKEDIFKTYFDVLKRAKAFSESWSNYYQYLINSDPYPTGEELEERKKELALYYRMPFETDPLDEIDDSFDENSVEVFVKSWHDLPEFYGWKKFEKYIEQERERLEKRYE